jgi:predicted phage-related endonuclease
MNTIITMNKNGTSLSQKAVENIISVETELEEVKKKEKELKELLLSEMKKRGIKKIDTPELLITYIEPTDREKFDSKKLREDNPDLYDEYVAISKVKESLRIKVK